jgi:hypothetical protein
MTTAEHSTTRRLLAQVRALKAERPEGRAELRLIERRAPFGTPPHL